MAWQATPATVGLLGAAALNFGLAIVLARRDVPGATPFAALTAFIGIWSFADAIFYGSRVTSVAAFWYSVGVVAATFAMASLLFFVLAYTGYEEWLTRKRVGQLVVPLATVGAFFIIYPEHELLWQFSEIVRTSPVIFRETIFGPVGWVYLLAMYMCALVSLALLVRQVFRTRGPFRRQALLVTVALVAPFVMNVLWALGLSPIPGLNMTIFTFTVSDAAIVLALGRFDLFDLTPVARHALVEEMDDLLFAVDESGRIADANPVARQLLDCDQTLMGVSAAEVIPDYEAIIESDSSTKVTINDGDGIRTFDAQLSELTDARNHSRGVIVLLRDITERRQAERRFQALIENSSDLTAVLDEVGRCQYISPAAELLYGHDPDAMAGEQVFQYIHPEDREYALDRFEGLVESATPVDSFEFRFRDARGNWRHLEASGQNLLDNPAVGGIVVNSREVTERVEYRQELERQNQHLNRFASIVSHDLRNPLSVIAGRLELIRRTGDLSHLDEIEAATERMDLLIDDLLMLSQQGETVDETQPVSLSVVVTDAWKTVTTPDAVLACETDLTVEADGDRLQQAFANIFRNAIEHGGSDVTVRVAETDAGFAISDDGPGIPAAERDSVFEWGNTTEPDGTGYGLAIVEQVIDAHGWSVTVTDSADGGARFEVTLS